EEFKRSLLGLNKPSLLLLAGDMVNRGAALEYMRIVDSIETYVDKDLPIIACFGNEEYEETRKELDKYSRNRVRFLEGEAIILDIGGRTIGVVGAPAPIDRRSKSNELGGRSIRQRFQLRVRSLSKLLEDVSQEANYTVLLMHYSPLMEEVDANEVPIFSWWITEATKEFSPNLIIHGHTHISTRLWTEIGRTRVCNVAIPATGRITEIQL
ncbi:MAG: metallophosphoesterase, partial [Promethearchaeota archaeon]